MTASSETVARRVGLGLAAFVLANVLIEAGLAAIVGNPLLPPFSTPAARFQLVGASIGRLAQIVLGVGLLMLVFWNHPKEPARRKVGRAFQVVAALALLPLIILFMDFGERSMGLPSSGLLRARIQFMRILLFWATVAGVLWFWGKGLVSHQRPEPESASVVGSV